MTESASPMSPSVTVFNKLLEPLDDFIQAQNRALPKHPNQKYAYLEFFRLMVYFYVSGTTSLKLLVQTRLNLGLLPESLGLRPELNRMIPTDFQIGSGNSSKRQALIEMAVKGVTYIADRGYMSFQLGHSLTQIQAHFIFRVKANWKVSTRESLPVSLPIKVQALFQNVTDELIRYTHDPNQALYRLVCFSVGGERYHLLTDRRDLTTFQVILLYAYRWQIELMFRFLKRTLNGIHLMRQDQRGVTIQFYMILIVALLELSLKQSILDSAEDVSQTDPIDKPNPKVKTEPYRLDGIEFVAALGRQMKVYWEIGIYWLTTLRDLLPSPFDERSCRILLNYS